jgi:hypothetical protein
MAWKTRLFMGLMLTVMLLAIAGSAMADDNNRHERREDRQEWREDWREEWREDWRKEWREDFCCDDEVVFFDHGFDFVPVFYLIEEIDIDCDGFDDDFDGLFDEGADCEVEIEFFDFD